MQGLSVPGTRSNGRALVFVLLLAGGLLLFLLGNNWNSLFPSNDSTTYKWSIAVLFLVLAVLLRQTARFSGYWQVAYALFVAAFANVLNWHLGNWLAGLLPLPGSPAEKLAVDKLSQAIPIVLAIILLTVLVRGDLGSIFLRKGDLRWGLRFGFVSFGIFVLIFAVIAVVQAGAPSRDGLAAAGIPLATLLAAIPWILIFVLANSLMEELWFRGLFLGKLTPLLGATASIFATALVFGASHLGATYVSPLERFLFPVIVFALGLLNARVMLKTASIWGSVLFHAGYDLIIVIPVLASMH